MMDKLTSGMKFSPACRFSMFEECGEHNQLLFCAAYHIHHTTGDHYIVETDATNLSRPDIAFVGQAVIETRGIQHWETLSGNNQYFYVVVNGKWMQYTLTRSPNDNSLSLSEGKPTEIALAGEKVTDDCETHPFLYWSTQRRIENYALANLDCSSGHPEPKTFNHKFGTLPYNTVVKTALLVVSAISQSVLEERVKQIAKEYKSATPVDFYDVLVVKEVRWHISVLEVEVCEIDNLCRYTPDTYTIDPFDKQVIKQAIESGAGSYTEDGHQLNVTFNHDIDLSKQDCGILHMYLAGNYKFNVESQKFFDLEG